MRGFVIMIREAALGLCLVLACAQGVLSQPAGDAPDGSAGQAQKPKLSITLEGYEAVEEPVPAPAAPAAQVEPAPTPAAPVETAPAPVQETPPADQAPSRRPESEEAQSRSAEEHAVERALERAVEAARPARSAASQQAAPEPAAPSAVSRTPARTPAATAPTPAAAARATPRAAPPVSAPPGRPSPILSMLDSTLHGSYGNTRAIARNLPGKYVERIGDKALAQKYSKQANDLLNKENRPAEALAAYRAAYEQDPSSSEITGSYGYTLFRNGRFAEARDMVIESLEIAPDYGAAWFVLGQVYGYLKQENLAYASFVNTCLFSKNISTSLGYLEREKGKYGEVSVQRAAGRALEACRRLASGAANPDAVASRPAPSEPEPLRSGPSMAEPDDAPPPTAYNRAAAPSPGVPDPYDDPPADPVPPPYAGKLKKNGKIGMVDIQAVVSGSRQFPEILARLEQVSKWERDRRLDEMLTPLLDDIRDITRDYARANGFSVVILAAEAEHLRQGAILNKAELPLADVDEGFLAFLNTPEGIKYRKKAPIQDMTGAVAAKLDGR
ncbi:MAG: tetratricopeptide repeat protein [Desulfovibrionaceae bacterium]|nr:tetratricopeptide repeat protein [Desulfovibrionaceae bacterium]